MAGPSPTLSTVIVAFDHAAELPAVLDALAAQARPGDEVIVVDNASSDDSAAVARRHGAKVLRNAVNTGFAAAANQGAAAARGDLLLLLNPDAVPEPGFRAAIERPWGGDWVAWMGYVLTGGRINTSGGVVHFTGLAWSGELGGPPGDPSEPDHEVGFVSGACLAIPRLRWQAVGGFPAAFFMYHEDVDLSLRLRLAGGRVGVVPAARVDHDYAFRKGRAKWRLLERNRWATILRTYPGPLLVLVAPALAATEAAIWLAALRGGWAPEKARACADVAIALPRLLLERRAVQTSRAVSPAEFAEGLTAELSSPELGAAGRSRAVRRGLAVYWAVVRRVLRPG